MNFSRYPLFFSIIFSISISISSAIASNSDNLQDTCPTAPPGSAPAFFFNGFPCKNPSEVEPSDFKTSKLNHPGDVDWIFRSATKLLTAAEFPGLNTLGLAVARTDMVVAGGVLSHSHPRAAEMMFVIKGTVLAGFLDTEQRLFKKVLREGDVFVVPKGLLHFTANVGFDFATVLSVMNSQNPGVVSADDGFFDGTRSEEAAEKIMNRLRSLERDDEKDEASENVNTCHV